MSLAKIKEEETFEESKARRAMGQRGKSAEAQVGAALQTLKAQGVLDFDRVPDTRAAGRFMPPQVADFMVYAKGTAIAVEVKSLKKGSRLGKGAFPQLPRMLRRCMAGCRGVLLVQLLERGLWIAVDVEGLDIAAKSWDVLGAAEFENAAQAVGEAVCLGI